MSQPETQPPDQEQPPTHGTRDEPGAGAGAPSSDGEGMSTGVKVALGCGGCLLLLLVGGALAVGVGGLWITDKADDFAESVERQAVAQTEATEILERLEREHSFDPPADGTVNPDRAERFFQVTDDAWADLEDWGGDLEELGDRLEDRDPGLGDIGAVFEGYGKLAESRVILARALEDHQMSLHEYLWTGLTLSRAHESMEDGSGGKVPQETRQIVRQNESMVAELDQDHDDEIGRETVFYLAWVWGSADASSFRALGLDTLATEP